MRNGWTKLIFKQIDMNKCTFLKKEVKEYSRCTVCTLTCAIPLIKSPSYQVSHKISDWIYKHPQVENVEYINKKVRFNVSGKAIRTLEDVNDPVIGTRIAESRAKKKAYKFCRTLYMMLAQDFKKQFQEYWNASQKFNDYYHKEVIHYNDIMIMQ